MPNEETTIEVQADDVVITKVQTVPKAEYLAQKQRELIMATQMQARQQANQAERIAKLQAEIDEVK